MHTYVCVLSTPSCPTLLSPLSVVHPHLHSSPSTDPHFTCLPRSPPSSLCLSPFTLHLSPSSLHPPLSTFHPPPFSLHPPPAILPFQAFKTLWYSSKHNMGFGMNRATWNRVKACVREFCTFDDYNWDWSLLSLSKHCLQPPLQALVSGAPRVFHIGTW